MRLDFDPQFFSHRYFRIFSIAVLFFWGSAVCLYYGRVGFMPLDQSIIFDGGWRIVCGQIPFRDFDTPNAVVPILLQAAFFKVFGVNWGAYLLHAAVFNGLFCLLVYKLLRDLGGSRSISFFYAFLSGLIFYPPFGVPYMEQHAFFFILLTLALGLSASRSPNRWKRRVLWSFCPLALFAAFFSKQVPTLFSVPVLAVILPAVTERNLLRPMLATVFISLMGIAAAAHVIMIILGLKYNVLLTDMIFLPFQLAQVRFQKLESLSSFPRILSGLLYPRPARPLTVPLLSFHLAALAALFILVFILVRNHHFFQRGWEKKHVLLKTFIAIAFLAIGNAYCLCTNNQCENNLPYLFFSLGITHLLSLHLISAHLSDKKPALWRSLISLIFISISFLDAARFNHLVNRTRMVHDMYLETWPLKQPGLLPKGFQSVRYTLPAHYHYAPQALKSLVQFLYAHKENFFLIGDASIIYGLSRRPSMNPSLWYHPGYSMPPIDSSRFAEYEKRLLSNIRKYQVHYIVLEGRCTFFQVSLASFPHLARLIRNDSPRNRRFGNYHLLRIQPPGEN